MARLVVIPQLTLAQEDLLKELADAGGEKCFAGRKLATARELWKKKQLAKVVPGKQLLGRWFVLTQHGREVADVLALGDRMKAAVDRVAFDS